MTKQASDARARLQDAALKLFRERGYERTTAAAIAAEAHVTERTFFRHFADKREVLFAGEAALRDALVAAVAGAPADLGAIDASFQAFRSVIPLLEGNRAFAGPRQELIAATPPLHERELAKLDLLAAAMAGALKARRVPDLRADLSAKAAIAAFAHAVTGWLHDADADLSSCFDRARTELKSF